jgi:methionyl-tRNA formyltransferase
MSKLTVMILCGRSPRHLYVANKLCAATNPVAVVQEVGSQWTAKKIFKLLRPENFFRKIWRWLRDRKRYIGGGEAKYFFDNLEPSFDQPELVTKVPHINNPEVIALAEKHNPDFIAVFGTSLLKGELLEKGRLGVINLHGGLSPHYRGADCTFWALYNNEPDQIGCTLHYIDPGIDTGDLIAHISPEVHEGDDELTLFWRAVQNSAEVYAEFFDRVENGEVIGQQQNEKGRLYQVKNRGLRHEKHLEKVMQEGLLNGIDLPLRVKWFKTDKG